MINKYRVHEVAKDFDMQSKKVIELLAKYFDDQKKHMTALEENELDVIFETFTQENQVENFDAYFATAKQKEESRRRKLPQRATAKRTIKRLKKAKKLRIKRPTLPHPPLSPKRKKKSRARTFSAAQRAKQEQLTQDPAMLTLKNITRSMKIFRPSTII